MNSLAWAELQYIEVPKHVHGEIFWLDLLSKIIFFLSKILPTLAIIDHNQINTTRFLRPKGENPELTRVCPFTYSVNIESIGGGLEIQNLLIVQSICYK